MIRGASFPGSVPERLAVAKEALTFLDEDARSDIFGGTALRLWPWLA
jgi:hypothetical protein